jgi:hypothetical protein
LACFGLSVLLWWEISDGRNVPTMEEVIPEGSALAAVPPVPADVPPRIEQLSEFLSRPVFSSTRRPPPPAAPKEAASPVMTTPPPQPPQTLKQLTLVGVVLTPDQRIAFIRAGNGLVSPAVEGQDVGGWQLKKILSDRVALAFGSTAQEILFPLQKTEGRRDVRTSVSAPQPQQVRVPTQPFQAPAQPR